MSLSPDTISQSAQEESLASCPQACSEVEMEGGGCGSSDTCKGVETQIVEF